MRQQTDSESTVMTPEQIVSAFDHAWARGDVDGLVSLYAPDATIESPLISHLTGRTVARGHGEIRELVHGVLGRGTRWGRHEPPAVQGNTVYIEYRRIPSQSEPQLDYVDVMEITGGMITSLRAYWGWRSLAALGAQPPASSDIACASRTRSLLLGAWTLVSWSELLPSGGVEYPLGPDARGLLTYTEDGHVTAQLVRSAQARFVHEDWRQASRPESASAWLGYFGYFGTFTVDDRQQAVIHHIAGSWFPNLVGTNQVRRFKLDGDRLILHADTPWGSVEIIWRR